MQHVTAHSLLSLNCAGALAPGWHYMHEAYSVTVMLQMEASLCQLMCYTSWYSLFSPQQDISTLRGLCLGREEGGGGGGVSAELLQAPIIRASKPA